MRVISFDPGGTTGVAYGLISTEGLMTVAAEQERHDHLGIWQALEKYKPHKIVCENFEYRNKSVAGLVLVSVEYIGIIRLYCQMNPHVELCMQKASQGKSYFSDTLLKKNGVYERGCPHGMDALRHLLHWYTFGPGYQFNKKGFM